MDDLGGILRALDITVANNMVQCAYARTPLERLDLCSRAIYRVPGQPYVVKVQHGSVHNAAYQSWCEWWAWRNLIDGGSVAHLVAPTHAVMVTETYDHLLKQHRYVCVSVQEYVPDDWGTSDWLDPTHTLISQALPFLIDLRDDQYVHGANGWVLVDYGLWHVRASDEETHDQYALLGADAWHDVLDMSAHGPVILGADGRVIARNRK